jgi:ABC-2 type transport system permease protein
MRKYLEMFLIAWQNGFVYRVNVLIWRFRQMLFTIMSLTLWTAIFKTSPNVFGYTAEQMTSYILLVALLQSIILATSLNGLAGEIYSGSFSKHFLKPQSSFLYLVSGEAADKLRNILFCIVELGILLAIFKPALFLPSLATLGLFSAWVILGLLMYFYICILFGCLGFWSPETWGPKFLFFMILEFTAGKMFPLDVLPSFFQKIIYFTPFPYLSYVQVQLFLNRLEPDKLFSITLGLVGWTIACWGLAHYFWKKGSHSFEATGM